MPREVEMESSANGFLHLASSNFPVAVRFRIGQNAPRLRDHPWGRELIQHEEELARFRQSASPYPWEKEICSSNLGIEGDR